MFTMLHKYLSKYGLMQKFIQKKIKCVLTGDMSNNYRMDIKYILYDRY